MKTKLAGIEFLDSELESAIADGKEFIAKGRELYALRYSVSGYSACPAYRERGDLPLVARGRFKFLTAAAANDLIGFELCLS